MSPLEGADAPAGQMHLGAAAGVGHLFVHRCVVCFLSIIRFGVCAQDGTLPVRLWASADQQ